MNNRKIILIGVIISGFLVLISIKVFRIQNGVPPPFSSPYIGGGWARVENNEVSFTATEQSSVYDFMEKLRREEKIDFTEKTYFGMGKFITEINGIKNEGGQNWIYYINGEKAQIGVSNYKIKPGDVVSWKYEGLDY